MMLIKSNITPDAETTSTEATPRPKLRLIENGVDVLDFTRAVIVNREQLTEALKDARHVSSVLHNVENLDDLNWQEMSEICRAAYRAAQLLTKKMYRGVNAVLLSMTTYASPYWLTFNQAQALGGHVRKGERSELIIFWKFAHERNAEEGSESITKGRPPILKYYRVFNIEQCEGLEKHLPPSPEAKAFSPVEAAASIIDRMPQKPDIRHDEPGAFYAPVRDFINLPRPETFDTPENYYAVAFHELTHSTGHASRLNREGVAGEGRLAAFGSANYSREELIAELGSAFLCAEAGIDSTLQNSAAYLQGWLDALGADSRMLITAASAAQRAVDFIIGDQADGRLKTEPER